MNIQSETLNDILVLRPFGRLDRTTAPELEELVRGALEDGSLRIVFDFSLIDYMSSDGLRVVLNTGNRLRAVQGRFAVAGLGTDVRALFDVSGVFSLYSGFETLDQAMDHVRAAPPGDQPRQQR
ncbi:MAG: STAS domain-containing protein [Janthinobacterium lividum]